MRLISHQATSTPISKLVNGAVVAIRLKREGLSSGEAGASGFLPEIG
jgi:hypothetical protein